MNAPCGQADCDCGHTIERLVKALEYLTANHEGRAICLFCGSGNDEHPHFPNLFKDGICPVAQARTVLKEAS